MTKTRIRREEIGVRAEILSDEPIWQRQKAPRQEMGSSSGITIDPTEVQEADQ
jgi:hypothetical protein